MKKILFILIACLFAAGLVAAKEAPKADKEKAVKQEEFRPGPNKEEMRKEFKEMKGLVDTYKTAKTDKEKADAQAAIKAKVAANYDRHLEFMAQRVKASQEKLAALAKKLEEGKKPEVKAKKIDEITAKILSGEKPMLFGPPQDGKNGPKGFDKNDKKHFMKGHKGGPDEDFRSIGKGGPDMEDADMLPPPPPDADEFEDLPEAH